MKNKAIQHHIQARLKELPKEPGVYFHKNENGEIIYIGKAAKLNNRIRHYFQKSRLRDPKTDALVAEIADFDWTVTDNELDALFLEAELIRRYRPKYNILLRDDKSLSYVRINYKADHPTVTLTRRPLDDNAKYFGPFYSSVTVRRALKLLRKAFPYSTHTGNVPSRDCLHVQLGLCPGLETGKTSLAGYRNNLKQLMRYLRGERTALIRQLEIDMRKASAAQKYEEAAKIRNRLQVLERLSAHIIFSDKETLDISKDKGLHELAVCFGLQKPPRRIEGYDISHMQGSDTVASMVVFMNGVPDKAAYRKFKMQLPGNDDFAHIKEVVFRRFSTANINKWGKPNLCIIDGGKGQLTSAIAARDELQRAIPMVGLAKRYEEVVIHNVSSLVSLDETAIGAIGGHIRRSDFFTTIAFPPGAHAIKLLQRIRDESHRFAVSYHTVLKRQRTAKSELDDIPGIGSATKKKLLRSFGSLRALRSADEAALAAVVGPAKAKAVMRHLGPAL